MSDAARKILQDVLSLPADEHLDLASEIIASADSPRHAGRDAAWLAKLDRRDRGATSPRGHAAAARSRGGLEVLDFDS